MISSVGDVPRGLQPSIRAVHLCLICMDGFKRILADGKKFIGQHALNGWRLQPKLITSPCINLL